MWINWQGRISSFKNLESGLWLSHHKSRVVQLRLLLEYRFVYTRIVRILYIIGFRLWASLIFWESEFPLKSLLKSSFELKWLSLLKLRTFYLIGNNITDAWWYLRPTSFSIVKIISSLFHQPTLKLEEDCHMKAFIKHASTCFERPYYVSYVFYCIPTRTRELI